MIPRPFTLQIYGTQLGKIKTMRMNFTWLVVAAFILWGCGGPQELPNKNSGNNTNLNKKDACSSTAKGDDCDGDTLTDECEKILGTNPCDKDSDDDGIDDNLDDPPPNPDPNKEKENEEAKNTFWQRAAGEVATSLALGGAGWRNQASEGQEIYIESQKVRLVSNGQGNPGNENTLCQGNNYLYVKFAGTVKYCLNVKTDTGGGCDGTPEPSVLEMCAENLNFGTPPLENLNTTGAKWTLSNFKWTRARSDEQKPWSPDILFHAQNQSTSQLTITVKDVQKLNNEPNFDKEMSTNWKVDWAFKGKRGDVWKVEVGGEEISKNWKRFDETNTVEARAFSPGLLGLWVNKD